MEENIPCYQFKKISFPDGLFESSVDATYIIHLEGNGRYESIIKEINEYHTTKTVYIVFNKGFKKCKKVLTEQRPTLDIIDCNMQIFKHANKNTYNSILLLEDDFFFNKEVKDSYNLQIINSFLTKHKDSSFCYMLGCIPFFMIPYDYFNFNVYSMGLHAAIYSKKYRNELLSKDQSNILDWDNYEMHSEVFKYFTFYKPLCYQLVPQTDNMKDWGNIQNPHLAALSQWVNNNVFCLLKLDKQEEPGYSIIYFISKLLFIILFLFIVALLYYFIYVISRIKYTKAFKFNRR